jgi:hypothetical protein
LALRLLGTGRRKYVVERGAEILCGPQAHAQMRHDHPIPNDLSPTLMLRKASRVMLPMPSLKP